MEILSGASSSNCDTIAFQGRIFANNSMCKIRVCTENSISPFFSWNLPFWKRALDVFGSIFLLVTLLPIFLVISILIKASSPGPIFFKQKRIGFGGKPFKFIKFRTMEMNCNIGKHREYLKEIICKSQCPDSEESLQPMSKLDHCNPDIFPLGRFLRKTCLDELPQFLNVLRGEMSLVGPRPPIPYEVSSYRNWHNARFDSVPGMTGLWQVSGKNRLSFKEMVRLDIFYSKNLLILNDLRILLKTPYVILFDLNKPEKRNQGKK